MCNKNGADPRGKSSQIATGGAGAVYAAAGSERKVGRPLEVEKAIGTYIALEV